MTELAKAGELLGKIFSVGLHNSGKVPADLWEAMLKLRGSTEHAPLFDGFLAGADLDLIVDHKTQWFTLMPRSKDSMFRMRGEDIRAKLKDGRQAYFAYAMMAVIASFYPTKYALNQGQFTEVRLDTVYATLDKMAEFARDMKGYNTEEGVDHLIGIAQEFNDMGRTQDGKGLNASFQEFYVLTALKTLAEEKWIKEEGNGYVPRNRFANMIRVRMQERNFLMGTLLDLYLDYYEDR